MKENKKTSVDKSTQDNYILTFLEQFHIKKGLIYKKHPIHQNFAASANGTAFDIQNNIKIDTQPICGHYKIIVGDKHSHVMLLEQFIFECFYGVLPPAFYTTHKNGCTKDNNLENLQLLHLDQLTGAEITEFNMLEKDIRDANFTLQLADIKMEHPNHFLWKNDRYEHDNNDMEEIIQSIVQN